MKILLMALLFSISLASAEIHEASISTIDYGKISGEENLLYLSDGSVIKIPQKDINTTLQFHELQKKGTLLKIKTTANRELVSFEALSKIKRIRHNSIKNEIYTPTIVDSFQKAEAIFSDLRDNAISWSQCYNRAHIWVYESKNTYDLNSMKAFLFFTRRYIRQYNYGWWFHVAPLTLVKNDTQIEERILDNSFTSGPTSIKSWTDIFMKNKVHCPAISRYSEYEKNQELEYCYLYKASMYYVQPLDLDTLERSGESRTIFSQYEVNRAYRNAFGTR
jgi:hypothetical protein